jgi:hypothetical protein
MAMATLILYYIKFLSYVPALQALRSHLVPPVCCHCRTLGSCLSHLSFSVSGGPCMTSCHCRAPAFDASRLLPVLAYLSLFAQDVSDRSNVYAIVRACSRVSARAGACVPSLVFTYAPVPMSAPRFTPIPASVSVPGPAPLSAYVCTVFLCLHRFSALPALVALGPFL